MVAFTYDALGRRAAKVICDEDGDPMTTIRYIYAGQSVIEECVWTEVEEVWEWVLDAEYVHGIGIDNVLSIERDSTRWYYHHDGLGSVTELTDSSGDLSQAYDYHAGNAARCLGRSCASSRKSRPGRDGGNATIYDPDHPSKNRYLYTGCEWDPAVALYWEIRGHHRMALR